MTTIQTITRATLATMLAEIKGCRAVTLTTRTDTGALQKDRVTKAPNPFGRILKVSQVNGMVGWDYGNSVNNQRDREGHDEVFAPLARAWGERVQGSPLVEYRGRLYVELKVQRVLGTRYETEAGEVIAADLTNLLPARKGESARQECEREVVLRDYALESVTAVTLAGETYHVVDGDDAEAVTSLKVRAARGA